MDRAVRRDEDDLASVGELNARDDEDDVVRGGRDVVPR